VSDFTDTDALALLRLLHVYVTEYDSCADMRLSDMAEDLCMSMDETPDEADQLRRAIEVAVTFTGGAAA